MSVHSEVHAAIDAALDKLKKAAKDSDRFDRLDAHAATVHMVVDEIPVNEPDVAPPVTGPDAPVALAAPTV